MAGVMTFSNAPELKAMLTTANGKIVDSEVVIQYKSEFSGHMGKIAL